MRQTLPLRTAAKPEVRSTDRNSSHTPLRLSGSAETTLTTPCTCGSSTRVRPVMRRDLFGDVLDVGAAHVDDHVVHRDRGGAAAV